MFFSESFVPVRTSIINFVRYAAVGFDNTKYRWVRDEDDLCTALDHLVQCVHDTSRMVGMPMYMDQRSFDMSDDLKRGMEEVLFGCRSNDEKERIILRKHNLVMYHLVIEPLIDQLSRYDHESVITNINDVIDDIKQYIMHCNIDSPESGVEDIKQYVGAMVQARETTRKASIKKRRTTRNRVEVERLFHDSEQDSYA